MPGNIRLEIISGHCWSLHSDRTHLNVCNFTLFGRENGSQAAFEKTTVGFLHYEVWKKPSATKMDMQLK